MGDQDLIRASDDDRQQVIDRLRLALQDGRLKMEEFTERVELALKAVTYGDLAPLQADLPPVGTHPGKAPATPPATPGHGAAAGVAARRSAYADLPVALKVLWTVWLVAVSVNLVVWVLVVGTKGEFVYPWPIWVAGPYGAALLGVSVPVVHHRRVRRQAALSPPADPRQLGSS